MNGKATILIAASIALVMACVGIGYAVEYSASTVNSNNSLHSTYIEISLEGHSQTVMHTFVFDDLVYYRDRTVVGNTVTDVYKSTTAESMASMFLWRTPADVIETTLAVKLAEPIKGIPSDTEVDDVSGEPIYYDAASVTLQFYRYDSSTQSWVVYGDAISMSTAEAQVKQGDSAAIFDTNTEYYCKATVTVSNPALDASLYGIGDQPSPGGVSTVSFGVVFIATATET